LGLCLESLGELPQALTAFNTCLTLSDLLKGTVLVSVGRVLDRLGRPNEALKAYEQALEHAEKNKRDEVRISALNNMAWIYLTAQPATVRDYDRAAILARQAYEATAPDDVYALETLALAELRVRNYEAARRSSMQGLEADAGSRWSIMIRAWAELELGNRRVATDLRARFSKMAADQDPPDLALDELVDQFDKRVAATYGGRRP
ncbi:MAG: tetratricopeptide repeat protein, partial [Phycisphaerae bacterium]